MTNQSPVISKLLSRLLPLDEVTGSLGISRATLYRGVRSGVLPKPVKISARRIGWRVEDIGKVTAGIFGRA